MIQGSLDTGRMTHVMKAASAADLLAVVPVLIGFEPRNSLVVVVFRGTRTCGALRVDLPGPGDSAVGRRLANHVVGTLCKIRGAESVVLAVFTDERFRADGASPPHSDLVRVFERSIGHTGFSIRDSLCVAADGWAAYGDHEIPPRVHPLSAIEGSTLPAAVPGELRRASVVPTRQKRVPDADPILLRKMASDLRQFRSALWREGASASEGAGAGVDPEVGVDLPALAEDALSWDSRDIDTSGALLLFAMQAPPTRDAIMLQWATSYPRAVHVWEGVRIPESLTTSGCEELGNLMMGIGDKPDRARVDRGISLLRQLVSRAADAERRAPLCMLAWLNWALGRGTVAGEYIEEALTIDRDYGMAQLLFALFGSGLLPDWAFEDSAAGDRP